MIGRNEMGRTLRLFGCGLLAPAFVFAAAPNAAADATAVASIKPVHSLLSAVMEGVGEPGLLVRSGSPHTYAMRPSDARALQEADLVFRIGPELESFLDKPLETLAGQATLVDLIRADGMTIRHAGDDRNDDEHDTDHAADDDHDENHAADDDHNENHAADDDHDHESDHGEAHTAGGGSEDHAAADGHDHGHGGPDAHVWLDPANARAMSAAMAAALIAADPANGAVYRANAERLRQRLLALEEEIASSLAPVASRNFVTFHAAYGYFIDRFGLAFAGEVTVDPARQPGAAHLAEIRERIEHERIVCVFAEPQFRPDIVDVVIEDTGARAGVLDPIGAEIRQGPDLYFDLMRTLGEDLAACLSAPRR